MGPVTSEIIQRLEEAFAPSFLQVHNDSDRHHGHAGHDGSGESHFTVEIVAEAFRGCGRVERQRKIHAVLKDLLEGRIHALAIKARAPDE